MDQSRCSFGREPVEEVALHLHPGRAQRLSHLVDHRDIGASIVGPIGPNCDVDIVQVLEEVTVVIVVQEEERQVSQGVLACSVDEIIYVGVAGSIGGRR